MNFDNCQPEVVSDVISGTVKDPTGVKVVKFGDSRSNRSRDLRLPHFVTNSCNDDDDNDDAGVRWSSHKGKKPYGVLPTTLTKQY